MRSILNINWDSNLPIYNISQSELQKKGINSLLLDVDGTLVNRKSNMIPKAVKNWIIESKKLFSLYLISNNPQISIQWNEPVANSGDVDKYYIQYETTATLNGASAGGDTVTVGPQSASTLTKSLADGVKFSSKYKFRVKKLYL